MSLNQALGPLCIGVLFLAGCTVYELPNALGEQCELNSDCDSPLVCVLGFCRVECATARDCAAGFDCLQDNMGRGGCQLVDETQCMLASDCPPNLQCTRYPDPVVPGRIIGECTNECACEDPMLSAEMVCASRDCPPGSACRSNDDGTRSCLDTSTAACVYDSDCNVITDDAGVVRNFEVCAEDRRCRVECTGIGDDRNCRNGETCQAVTLGDPPISGFLCVFTAAGADAGPGDAGTDS